MTHLAMIGTPEIVVIVGVVLLIFGGRKLPELARAMGTSITEFKKGLKTDAQLGEGERDRKDQKDESKDES